MTVLVAWGNIQEDYPLHLIPQELLTEKLLSLPNNNARVKQRFRCQWVAHFLLWQLLKTQKINTALLKNIFRTDSGRPEFPVRHIDFNISHSDNWVAVVLQIKDSAEESIVGIDIEYPKKTRNFTSLLTHFASKEEQKWFQQQEDNTVNFYRIWCLREAVLKSQGVGIVKLSEVQHYPEQLKIYSHYCPKGELVFTSDLPFYLAVFFNSNNQRIQYFTWDNNQLLEQKLVKKINYLVNSEPSTLKSANSL